MSLEPRADHGVPELTARLVRAAFPEGDPGHPDPGGAWAAARRREDFAAAFPRRGRPAASPGALALVSVLQSRRACPHRQAADQVRARMDWKFLLGLELDDPGFDFTVSGDFRTRLIRHGMEERVLDAVLARLSGCRAAARWRTAADRLHARAGRGADAEPDGVRRRDAAGGAGSPGRRRPRLAGPGSSALSWADRYGARIDCYRFPKGEDARERWAGQVGRDGFALLDAVGAPRPRDGWADPGGRGPAPRLGRAVSPGRGGGALAGGQATSRQADSGWPPLTTRTPATASSADPAGRATRCT